MVQERRRSNAATAETMHHRRDAAVRRILAVSTPARLRVRNRGSRFLKFFNLVFMTVVFLALPAASPTPKLLTRRVHGMLLLSSLSLRAVARVGWEAEITDLVCETSMPSW